MSESANSESSHSSRHASSSNVLVVGGVHYANSAAKFWPKFLDEVKGRHPRVDQVELKAPGDGVLHPGLLIPEEMVSDAMGRMDEEMDFSLAMQGIAAELEAVGPPSAVEMTVFDNTTVLETKECTDGLDAEIFPFLLVWLLEWSCLTEAAWNRTRVGGAFEATDPDRGFQYRIRFYLTNKHLREGLFLRSLTLSWSRIAVPCAEVVTW